MAERRFLKVQTLRELDSSSTTISTTYLAVGSALPEEVVSVAILNESSSPIYVSLDGGTTTHMRVQAGGKEVLTGILRNDLLQTLAGNAVYVKRGGGSDIISGIVSVAVLYRDG